MQQVSLPSTRSGIDVPAALKALADAGITRQCLAHDLKVHGRTVRRWERGLHQPSAKNLTALRELVDVEIATICAGQSIASQRHLSTWRQAKFLLTTDAERTEQDRKLAEMRAALLATGALVSHRSVTAQVDPFDLVGNTQPDDLFGVAA
jgi:hypothetical protein